MTLTADQLDDRRIHRPAVVAIGGGHGLASSLRASLAFADELTGVVSVADDGGSSGRLRRELGLPAPGDLRRCLSALASEDSLLAQSLEHRFDRGALEGHAVGNLLIAGLASAGGDFAAAVQEVARLVGAVGTMLPATVAPVTLVADSDNGELVGQVTIERATGITNLRFEQEQPEAPAEAVEAILSADLVVIGPGSLFTSVLAAAVVPQIKQAISETKAHRVFVANVANDRAEARGFDLPEHVEAIRDHGIAIDAVVAPINTHRVDEVESLLPNLSVRVARVAADDGWQHDPVKLGAVLAGMHRERERRRSGTDSATRSAH